MNLLKIQDTTCVEMVTLKVNNESFVSDIEKDLTTLLKLEVLVNDNLIGIVMNKELSWDLQFDIIKLYVKHFNDLVYECLCGDFEYLENKMTCACGTEICDTCKNFDIDTNDYICDDCLEEKNNEELGDYI